MKRVHSAFAAIALLIACSPESNGPDGNKTPSGASSITVGAEQVSAISVVLKGKANLGSSVAADLKVGFQYSTSAGILPSNSTTVEATDADANYNYTAGITGLEPNTLYYFRSFVRQNGQDTYGETKSFTTKEVSSMLETKEANDIEAAKATMNAKLDLTDVLYKNLVYGFLWGSSESSLNSDIKCSEIKQKSFSVTLTNLPHKTQYWYKAYLILDDERFYGEVKTFTTDVVPVVSISLDITEHTFDNIGSSITIKASILPADATDKSLEWSSNNENVAVVDANGNVTAIDNGTATITATTKDQGKTATCTITVVQKVTSITLDQTSLTLNEGQERTLMATIIPDKAADKSLNWTSSDESVATVDQAGKVYAVSKGTATIKAKANDSNDLFASCSVTVNRPISSIELDKTSIILYNGQTETIAATVTPSSATDVSVTWTSSNPSVAKVSSSGVITGQSRGTATVTVTANDGSGVNASCEVEVKQYVTTITLSATSLWLAVGENDTVLIASILPDNANDKTYSWSSSDESVATVDANGRVMTVSTGNTTIRATANDGSGVFASCLVSVCPAGAVDLGLSVYWATCNLNNSGFASSPEVYGDYYAWGETETKENYSWETYKWCNGDYDKLTKYNTTPAYGNVDNKTILDAEDDVAHVKLGGNWRIPTIAEWGELMNNCTWTWTTQNGVYGRLVTSNKNGNSIFLPAAGRRSGSGMQLVGTNGDYWSSSLDTKYPYYASYVYFRSDGVYGAGLLRNGGFSVRPVSE